MAKEVRWGSEIEAALKEAKASKRAVLLDFSHAPQ